MGQREGTNVEANNTSGGGEGGQFVIKITWDFTISSLTGFPCSPPAVNPGNKLPY